MGSYAERVFERIRSKVQRALILAALAAPATPLLAEAPSREADSNFATQVIAVDGASEADTIENTAPPYRCYAGTACCAGHLVDWSEVPKNLYPMPRPGNFPVPPQGPGYYSVYDRWTGNYRQQAPRSPYPPFAMMPPSFFDVDFRYVEGISPDERTWVESLKRIPVGDCWTFSTGGHTWLRFMNERNSRLTESDNDYLLARVRLFGDLMYGDLLRFYGEYIWADSFSEELAPQAIDVNRGDALNLFVDVKLGETSDAVWYGRVGRQELLFGSQRLVSTLDWANTRRTFDGVRLMRKGESWDWDFFYTAFVPPNPNGMDQLDDRQEFGGSWFTWRVAPGRTLDLYYLYLDDTRLLPPQLGIARGDAEIHTWGFRHSGNSGPWLWDVEAALQLGQQGGNELVAGMASLGGGHNWNSWYGNPTLWLYYDYASGDPDPASGQSHTFHQLFPFGHYYLGWIDLVGRQNIHDANVHLWLYPQPWMAIWLQYHHFWLDRAGDALYNAAGVPIRRDATGSAGRDVGDEIDIVTNYHIGRYSDLMIGYSRLFGGGFLRNTASPTAADDAELFYLMWQRRW
ncbi:MAG: hypothetical protein KatS3mg110_0015 [Pirellulaceae bacterium]|nr:MAG: hypothetical protein KatS3mg110_0015 [Pirellulaceae bacterium]